MLRESRFANSAPLSAEPGHSRDTKPSDSTADNESLHVWAEANSRMSGALFGNDCIDGSLISGFGVRVPDGAHPPVWLRLMVDAVPAEGCRWSRVMLDALLRAEGVERGRAAVPGGAGGDPRRAFGGRGGAVDGGPASGRSGPSRQPRWPLRRTTPTSGPVRESRARAWVGSTKNPSGCWSDEDQGPQRVRTNHEESLVSMEARGNGPVRSPTGPSNQQRRKIFISRSVAVSDLTHRPGVDVSRPVPGTVRAAMAPSVPRARTR
jgi:hypothetical protein